MWQCLPPENAYGEWCTTTRANVNVRASPTQSSGSAGIESSGTTVVIMCWAGGESIYGDDIWYMTSNFDGIEDPGGNPAPQGYIAGYYLNTGNDPNGAISKCDFG